MNLNYCQRLSMLLVVLIAAAGSMACSSSSSANQNDETSELTEKPGAAAQELFLRANEALDAREWDEAIELYEQVTDLDPERWEAHMNRGIALTANRKPRVATEAFSDALYAGGNDQPIVYFNLGNHYQERGLYESAIDAYRTSMAVAGEVDYETLLNISASFVFLNSYDKALNTLHRALELNPDDPRVRITIAVITHSDGNAHEALELFDEILASHPDLAEVHYNRGFVLMRLQENREAQQAFETYLELDPDGPYVGKAESHLSTLQSRIRRNDS